MIARLGRALTGYHDRHIHRPRVARIGALLAELLAEHGGADSLLDVGSGDGTVALAVGQRLGAARVEGVDIALRPTTAIAAQRYDGRRLPFADRSFGAVLLSDVLHHADAPGELLAEALRVTRRLVAVKDHLAGGSLSRATLRLMDLVGNASTGVAVPARYLGLGEWLTLVHAAGGRLVAWRWPVRIHDLPWRLVTRSELQVAFLAERAPHAEGAPRAEGTA